MRPTRKNKARRGVVAVEAAVILPVLIILMFGIWEVGRVVQVNQIVINAAREGARLAAGGYVNSVPVTSTMVTTAVQDYMLSAGLPATAVNNSTVTLNCQASPSWSDPSAANPLDAFQVTVTIPSGAAFNSLKWNLLAPITNMNQMSATVAWRSLNNTEIVVDTALPY
ncbi:MAG: TadE/TadG family type IV pilus assembly protein [Pirellulales bacterium]